jgi:hypothetical protein
MLDFGISVFPLLKPDLNWNGELWNGELNITGPTLFRIHTPTQRPRSCDHEHEHWSPVHSYRPLSVSEQQSTQRMYGCRLSSIPPVASREQSIRLCSKHNSKSCDNDCADEISARQQQMQHTACAKRWSSG